MAYAHSRGFESEDPLGFDAGDTNLFRYVKNNATNATDPQGTYIGLWHTKWTRDAMEQTKCPEGKREAAAEANLDTDFEPNSQSIMWWDTRKHGMSGMKSPVISSEVIMQLFNFQWQTKEEAKATWQQWIDECMAKAVKGDIGALGNAMHAAQGTRTYLGSPVSCCHVKWLLPTRHYRL